MRTSSMVVFSAIALGACNGPTADIEAKCGDGGTTIITQYVCDGGSAPADMTKPPCLAAEGLPGKNLFCVDFKDHANTTSLTGGWSFSACSPSTPAGVTWTINSGVLELNTNNFLGFSGDCRFNLPSIPGDVFTNNNTFTLSVLHTVDIYDGIAFSNRAQLAQVYLSDFMPTSLLGAVSYHKQTKWKWVQTLTKKDLPGSPSAYQPFFRLSVPSAAGGSFTGWHIESIAINGQ